MHSLPDLCLSNEAVALHSGESSTTVRPQSRLTAAQWEASLELDVREVQGKSRLTRVQHTGPLRVQKPFHPEANGTCHIYVLHPPGGVAGGDALRIRAVVEPDARALITSPAAQKLYRCTRQPSSQSTLLQANASHLEWLPQETIAFSGTRAQLSLRVELQHEARFMGWDILCLGRPASHEPFVRGWVDQRIDVYRDGEPLWSERLRIDAGARLLDAAWGLRGCPTVATLLCAPSVDAAVLETLRASIALRPDEHFAASAPRGMLVCRFLGSQAWRARAVLTSAWNVLRPCVMGSHAVAPRIWAT